MAFADWLTSWYRPTENLSDAFTRSTDGSSVLDTVQPQIQAPANADSYRQAPETSFYDMSYDDMLKNFGKIGIAATAQNVHDEAVLDRKFQEEQAEAQRDWYKDMSDTSYQRQVEDLEAAGLNPILGWSRGFGGADSSMPAAPSGRSTNLGGTAPNIADYLNSGANIINAASNLLGFFTPKLTSSTSSNVSRVTSNVTSNSRNLSHLWHHKG